MYARDEPAFKAHLYRHHLSGAIVTRFRGMARKVPAFHFIYGMSECGPMRVHFRGAAL